MREKNGKHYEAGNEKGKEARGFSKWKGESAALAIAVFSQIGCGCDTIGPTYSSDDAGILSGQESGTGPVDSSVEHSSVDASCATPSIQCANSQSFTNVLLTTNQALGNSLVLGDLRVRLDSTGEANGDQVATFDLIDICGNALDTKTIPSGGSDTLKYQGMGVQLSVGVVTVLNSNTARVSANLDCPEASTLSEGGSEAGIDAGDANPLDEPDSAPALEAGGDAPSSE